MIDLFSILPSDICMDRYCDRDYWVWEDETCQPALEKLGYERITFRMGERDSFGPLTRIVRAYKGGACVEFVYG
jgi:hypothetical protein